MKIKENFLFASLIRLMLVCLFVEFGFHFLAFGFSFDSSLITIICCTLTVCPIICIIASFFPVKVGKIIISVICWLFSAYAITQLQFHNFIGSYISVKATFDGVARITEFVGQFIMTIKPIYWTLLLGALISEILVWKRKYKKADDLMVILGVVVFALYMHIMTIVSITSNGQMGLYEYPQYISKALQQFGLGRFIYLDFKSIGQEEQLTVTIPNATPSPTSTPQATSEINVEDESHRTIDDSAWIEMMNQEKNNDMKTIDQYLMQRTIPDYNDHTGMFKDMNVIYIMIEAFDYMALDEELTPTLVRMKKEGWDFSNHYTPKFSCATGESEFVSEISLVPQSDVCTPNQYATNHWPNSIFQMFKNNGYDTY
ncbi:MAG: sulfatase-like hydrolase/transferase, partial [Butyrivibrio sp.]|nr:sulfatase-like hydrolase/transferase [Butyrivibrio sp.]